MTPRRRRAAVQAEDPEEEKEGQVAIVLIGIANCLDLMVRNNLLETSPGKELNPAVSPVQLTH